MYFHRNNPLFTCDGNTVFLLSQFISLKIAITNVMYILLTRILCRNIFIYSEHITSMNTLRILTRECLLQQNAYTIFLQNFPEVLNYLLQNYKHCFSFDYTLQTLIILILHIYIALFFELRAL